MSLSSRFNSAEFAAIVDDQAMSLIESCERNGDFATLEKISGQEFADDA
jgi:hypothetical protein